MKIKSLLTALINSSEKAANIARTCRSNPDLFNLLIEEKKGSEKNERFFQDFKTLADVLIQESIRHDISTLFPHLNNKIKGEESNKFENALGEKIIVEINQNPQATTQMLLKVLDNNENAATALSNEIHKNVKVDEVLEFEDFEINDNLGIWIDPIDGTQEYIKGGEIKSEIDQIIKSGLKCATVLIGVYEKESGNPIIGVINQPFADGDKSEIFYGFCACGFNFSNIKVVGEREPSDRISILSSSESKKSSFKSVCAAGAGYKALMVIQRCADVYYLSKGSTFKWDTCGPQAILKSLGGEILDMKKSLEEKQPVSLNYLNDDEKCNEGGIITYKNIEDFQRLLVEFNE